MASVVDIQIDFLNFYAKNQHCICKGFFWQILSTEEAFLCNFQTLWYTQQKGEKEDVAMRIAVMFSYAAAVVDNTLE